MKKILLALATLTLVGCATKPIEVTTNTVERAPLVLPAVDTYRHKPVEWIIMTPQTIKATFDRLKEDGGNVVLIGLSDQSYENLSMNMAAILEILQQYNAKVRAYEEYYKLNKSENQ